MCDSDVPFHLVFPNLVRRLHGFVVAEQLDFGLAVAEKFEISKYLNSAYIYKNQNFDITILGIHTFGYSPVSHKYISTVTYWLKN